MKIGEKTTVALLLVANLVLVNYLASSYPAKIDLTAQKIYTLSAGTRNLISKIEEPVALQFYFSRSLEGLPISFKNYATRVEELLRQYEAASNGLIQLEVIDPEPDSEEEESAARAGIQGQNLQNGGALYFGLSAAQADNQQTIAFFTTNRESFLEYDISQLLYSVQQFDKPRLGLLTSLPLKSPMSMPMPGQPRPTPDQVVISEWERTFEIVEIQASDTELPDNLDVLAVIHPQGLNPQLVYAIDQHVLSGRPLFLALDPSSRYFKDQGGQNQMYGQPAPNVTSDLPNLLAAWGVSYDSQQVVADASLASTVITNQGNVRFPVWLTLPAEQFNPDVLPTSTLKTMLMIEPGSFSIGESENLKLTPMIRTTASAGNVASMMLNFTPPEELARQIKPDGKAEVLAGMIEGTFRTAFPDGRPADATDETGATSDEDTPSPAPGLTESVRPGTVILVMDSDWLLDSYSVRRMNFLGMTALDPLNDNLSFASSALEFLGGSDDLIAIRGKGTVLRPFIVVQRMEADAQERYQEQLDEVETRLREVQNQLSQLATQQTEGRQLVATPEIQKSIEDYRAQEASVRAERRKIRKALRENIERLGTVLLLANLLVVPVGVGIVGIAFFTRRNRRQKS
ncbi:MAG: GldG family protein [Opitutaceae bacterium]